MPREQQFPSHFLAASLVVMTLWLWKMLHDTSCLALTMPLALGMATTYGLLQYHLQRRRWLLSCYLTDGSGLRRLLWRPWLTTARCLLTALPLTVVLAVFVAFADQAEWYMLLATGVLVPVLAVAARAWPGSHFRDHSTDVGPAAAPRNILTTRIAGSTCLAVGLTGCVYYGYHSPVPHELIYPRSMEQTLAAFAGTARSTCATVERTLGWAAQAEGLSWYVVTSLSDAPWLATNLRPFLWIAFLVNAAMAFGAVARSVEGAMLLTDRLTERLDER